MTMRNVRCSSTLQVDAVPVLDDLDDVSFSNGQCDLVMPLNDTSATHRNPDGDDDGNEADDEEEREVRYCINCNGLEHNRSERRRTTIRVLTARSRILQDTVQDPKKRDLLLDYDDLRKLCNSHEDDEEFGSITSDEESNEEEEDKERYVFTTTCLKKDSSTKSLVLALSSLSPSSSSASSYSHQTSSSQQLPPLEKVSVAAHTA